MKLQWKRCRRNLLDCGLSRTDLMWCGVGHEGLVLLKRMLCALRVQRAHARRLRCEGTSFRRCNDGIGLQMLGNIVERDQARCCGKTFVGCTWVHVVRRSRLNCQTVCVCGVRFVLEHVEMPGLWSTGAIGAICMLTPKMFPVRGHSLQNVDINSMVRMGATSRSFRMEARNTDRGCVFKDSRS